MKTTTHRIDKGIQVFTPKGRNLGATTGEAWKEGCLVWAMVEMDGNPFEVEIVGEVINLANPELPSRYYSAT